jgi:hypothetical protein
MTYSNFLAKNKWQEINLFEPNLDLSQYKLWGHLTEPQNRHTRGVAEYLKKNPNININDHNIARMLVSGVFDEHTYSLNMMLGSIFHLPIYWIPLDAKITRWNPYPTKPTELIGDDLTNNFFKENNLDLQITISDRINVANESDLLIRQKIEEFKKLYDKNYQQLFKNFLEVDVLLYTATLRKFEQKYESL